MKPTQDNLLTVITTFLLTVGYQVDTDNALDVYITITD